jgi:hypothetical protein
MTMVRDLQENIKRLPNKKVNGDGSLLPNEKIKHSVYYGINI